jgi:hypothetical protein
MRKKNMGIIKPLLVVVSRSAMIKMISLLSKPWRKDIFGLPQQLLF